MLEIQETEAKYYRTLEDIEKVRAISPGKPRVRVLAPVPVFSLSLSACEETLTKRS